MKTNNKSIARWARASVEVIVATLVVSTALFFFGLTLLSGRGDRSTAAVVQPPARYHVAADLPASPAAENEPIGSTAANTTVQDGVTVVSPPLLVPVVNIDPEQGQPAGLRETSRHRSHHISRTHTTAVHQTRIVGLSAARKVVSANP